MRHQLPVFSPVSLRTVASVFASTVGKGRHRRDELVNVLCREYSAESAVLCGSGTQALQVAIMAAREMAGRDVIVAIPAFTCFDVASAAIGAGGPVALYDVEPESLAPDLDSLELALQDGARVVVVCPLYGIPVDWSRIQRTAASHGAMLIEDAAQGLGARYADLPLGALGDISIMSFGRGKGWTGGSGGAVLFRRRGTLVPALAEPSVSSTISWAAKLAVQWGLGRPQLYGLPNALPSLELGETVYHEPGTPIAMSESAAAGVLESRSDAMREAETRRSNAHWVRRQLESHPELRAVESSAPDSVAGYLRFPILARSGINGFGVGARLLGIAPSYPKPLLALPALQGLIVRAQEFPGAMRLAAELVTLPVHSLLSDSDRMLLAQRIRDYADS